MEPGEFEGVAGRTLDESTPWWPPLPSAPDDAPNVVVVLLDDVGYAQFGCYGSDIATPTFDRIAADGLRYSNFHTTALCSPTRAALLTGRNHHASGVGRIVETRSRAPSRAGSPSSHGSPCRTPSTGRGGYRGTDRSGCSNRRRRPHNGPGSRRLARRRVRRRHAPGLAPTADRPRPRRREPARLLPPSTRAAATSSSRSRRRTT